MENQLKKYFKQLSNNQLELLQQFNNLLLQQNEVHNLISRADIDNIFERHILHSLSIAKFIDFKADSKILDLGTGGGLPGIPLAILFPNCNFVLCDSISKKVNSVKEMAESLNLKNVKCICSRAENINEQFDFVVTRAVAKMHKLKIWTDSKILHQNNHKIKNGIIALKGGDLTEELKKYKKKVVVKPISEFFEATFFETKFIVYLSQ